jgi:hypothetical protein
MNITAGEETFNSVSPLLAPCPNAPTVACNYPVAFSFPTPLAPSGGGVAPTKPLGNAILIKSCGDVTMGGNSGAYLYGQSVGVDDANGDDYIGTTEEDVFLLPEINNNESGLMGAQMLNRLFGHIEYAWDTLYTPKIGLFGSYGFGSSKKYFTAWYWDVGCYVECSF